jgi:hypothetical protein
MVFGMAANYAKSNARQSEGEVNPIFRLFLYWVLILCMLCAYEFIETFKKIYFLYIMLIMGGLAQVRGVHIFIDKASIYHKEPITTRRMVNAVQVAYGAHLVLLGLVNDADYGAFCKTSIEYPVCMIVYFIVWLCFFGVGAVFYYNNFWIDEEIAEKKDGAELAMKERLLEVGDAEDRARLDADGDGKLDELQQDKDADGEYDDPVTNSQILKKMIDRFALFHCFFLIYVTSLLIAAYRINANESLPQVDYLKCEVADPENYTTSEVIDDQVWVSSKIGGKLMSLFHVIMIMMGSVQAEQAFYTVPHKIGYYDTQDLDIIESKVI